MTPRILIVDDEETILFAGEEYFTCVGYAVDCARARRDAEVLIEHASASGASYAAVIADLRIRGVSDTEGLEVLDYVRKRCPATLRILLTAYGSCEIELRARALEVNHILRKPIPLPDLARIISRSFLCNPTTSWLTYERETK